MLRRLRYLSLCLSLCLSACAPVILGRTPTPVAVGTNEVYLAGGGSFSATPLVVCRGPELEPECPFEGVGKPDYWPKAASLQLMNAWGTAPGTELSSTFMLLPLPGYRFGGKTLLAEHSGFALDYGASLFVSNVGLDVGLLAGVPFSGGEVYSGLRGFGSVYWSGGGSVSAALTVGVIGRLEARKAFIRGDRLEWAL